MTSYESFIWLLRKDMKYKLKSLNESMAQASVADLSVLAFNSMNLI